MDTAIDPAATTERMVALKDAVEALSKAQHIDILRLCNERGVVGSENKNGVFINLTRLTEPFITDLEQYLAYIQTQEAELNEFEVQKKVLTTKYFT
jgi:hypothetical protein